MDALIIFAGTYLIAVVGLVGFVYLLQSPLRHKIAMLAALSLPVAYVVAKLIGSLWYNARPFVESGLPPLIAHSADNGFPSDHTLLAAAIASVVFVYNRALGTALFVLALMVGAARVFAGVHHTVDIVASALIAAVAVAFVWRVMPHRWR